MTGAKTKIAIKLKRDGVYVNYAAKVGDYMSIEGYTIGGRHEVKQIIRRALRAEKPLPNHIKEIVAAVARQVLLWTDVYKVWGATAGMTVDVGVYSYISIYATLRYDVAELIAVLDGFDGFAHAQHGITRWVQLDRRPNSATAGLLLQMSLLKVAKYAYNIYDEDENTIRFGRFDDDHSDDDDDDSASLKIWTL